MRETTLKQHQWKEIQEKHQHSFLKERHSLWTPEFFRMFHVISSTMIWHARGQRRWADTAELSFQKAHLREVTHILHILRETKPGKKARMENQEPNTSGNTELNWRAGSCNKAVLHSVFWSHAVNQIYDCPRKVKNNEWQRLLVLRQMFVLFPVFPNGQCQRW